MARRAYVMAWSQQVGYFVQTHAERHAVVRISVGRPVSGLEHLSLEAIEGWRQRNAAGTSAAPSHDPLLSRTQLRPGARIHE